MQKTTSSVRTESPCCNKPQRVAGTVSRLKKCFSESLLERARQNVLTVLFLSRVLLARAMTRRYLAFQEKLQIISIHIQPSRSLFRVWPLTKKDPFRDCSSSFRVWYGPDFLGQVHTFILLDR